MSNSCTGVDCLNTIGNLIDQLRDTEKERDDYETRNTHYKRQLKRPSKTESMFFQKIFNSMQILIDCYFGKNKKEDTIRQIFLDMIDSVWSLLATRYSDKDAWLDLKYLGSNIVEKLANLELSSSVSQDTGKKNINEQEFDTIDFLKKETQKSAADKLLKESKKVDLTELNNDLEFFKKETNLLKTKVNEQNAIIKNLIKSFTVKLNSEKKSTSTNTNVTALNTTTSSVSSSSFNLTNTSQVTTSIASPTSDKMIDSRGYFRSTSSLNKDSASTLVCPVCKVLVDQRRCSIEKFERHVQACKESFSNAHLKELVNDQLPPSPISPNRKSIGSTVSQSSNSSGNLPPQNNTRRPLPESPNYMIIQNFEAKPRKRL